MDKRYLSVGLKLCVCSHVGHFTLTQINTETNIITQSGERPLEQTQPAYLGLLHLPANFRKKVRLVLYKGIINSVNSIEEVF